MRLSDEEYLQLVSAASTIGAGLGWTTFLREAGLRAAREVLDWRRFAGRSTPTGLRDRGQIPLWPGASVCSQQSVRR